MRVRVVVATVFVVGLAGAAGFAEERADGVSLFEQARFDDAEAFFRRDLESFEATAPELARAYLYLAAIALLRGEDDAATRHVEAAVALDGAATAPPGSPLRLEALIEARAAAQPEGMVLTVELPERPVAGAPVGAQAALSGAPEGLVSSLRLTCDLAGQSFSDRTEGSTLLVQVPTTAAHGGQRLACTATAHLETGAVVRIRRAEAVLDAAPDLALAATTVDGQAAARRRRRIGLGFGLGLGAAILAVAVALAATLGAVDDDVTVGGVTLEPP
jgi:hypothetical protein